MQNLETFVKVFTGCLPADVEDAFFIFLVCPLNIRIHFFMLHVRNWVV